METLDINAKEADDTNTSWKQHKMMIGADRQTLQTLIDNGTINPEIQKKPWQVLDTIITTVKFKDHFWHFWDELLSDVCKLPDEGIHALNISITALVNQCKFPHDETRETLKIKVLQHVVRYQKRQGLDIAPRPVPAHLQGPSHPLPIAWVLMQAVPEGQWKGQADLTSLSAVTSSASSIHQNALTTPQSASVATLTPQASAWLMARSVITVAARTTTLPHVDETGDPVTPPSTAEPDYPDSQADHPRESRSRCNWSNNRCRSSHSPNRHSSH